MFTWKGKCKQREGTEASRVSGDSFWSQISEGAVVTVGTEIRSWSWAGYEKVREHQPKGF